VKKSKSWRLSEEALEALEVIKRLTGVNETACVETALIEQAEREQKRAERRKGKKPDIESDTI